MREVLLGRRRHTGRTPAELPVEKYMQYRIIRRARTVGRLAKTIGNYRRNMN